MQGKKATQLELATLSKLLRVGRLAESVRECVLPDLEWFTLGSLLREFSFIYRHEKAHDIITRYRFMKVPEVWVAKARTGSTPTDIRQAHAEFVWRVPASEVLGLMQGKDFKSLWSSSFYAKGAFFKAHLKWFPVENFLSVYLHSTGEHGYPKPTLLGVNCSGIHCGRVERALFQLKRVFTSSAWGGDVFPSCKSGDEASLEEYLVDGHLVLKFKVHGLF